MRTFKINESFKELIEKSDVRGSGKDSKIREGGMMLFVPNASQFMDFDSLYHRKNIALKIVKNKDSLTLCNPVTPNKPAGSLIQLTQIQNQYALAGIAPRVYDIIKLVFNDETHYTQLIEEILGEHIIPDQGVLDEYSRYGKNIGITFDQDARDYNYKKDKILDFGTAYFKEEFSHYLHKLIKREGGWLNDDPYHTISELGIVGTRTMTDRAEELKLDDIDFEGKTVLDIGCSLGEMSREYNKRGATRVVGTDLEKTINVTKQIDLYFNCFNNDYFSIETESDIKKFDILSFLSVCGHVDFNRVAHLADTVIFEGHAPNTEQHIEKWLKPHFSSVKKIKERNDQNKRLAYIARR